MNNIKGYRIKRLREKRGLNQYQLAERLDLSPSTICMIEVGKREGTKETIQRIADFFKVSVDFLEGRNTQEDMFREFLLSLDTGDDDKFSMEQVAEIIKHVEEYRKSLKQEE